MQPLPNPLPPHRPVSDRDRALRATIAELVVHTRCARIRGPIGESALWQSCPCEDEPVRWAADVSRLHDLCTVCARCLAGGISKWSWLACGTCRRLNEALGQRTPLELPLGRHSIMNGTALRLGTAPAELDRRIDELADMAVDWATLDDWLVDEVHRLAASQGWSDDDNVPLGTWQEQLPASVEASVNAFSRLLNIDVRRHVRITRDGRILSTPQGILDLGKGFE
jgi:hypothetical protein